MFAIKYLKKLRDVCLRTELLIDMEMKLWCWAILPRQFCKFSRAKLSYFDHWPPWSQPRDHAMLSIHQELNLNCWFCLHLPSWNWFSHTTFFILDLLSYSKTRCVFKSMVSSTADIWDEKPELKTIAEEINLAGNSCEDIIIEVDKSRYTNAPSLLYDL